MAERMDHEKMRRASELPVTGPAATDSLAASGGLELPGRAGEGLTADQRADLDEARKDIPATAASVDRLEGRDPDDRWRAGLPSARHESGAYQEPARTRAEDPGDVSAARLEPIPGEHDDSNEVASQPGLVGTTGYGVDAPEADDPTVDDELAKEARWEGGGRFPRRDTK